MKKIEVNNIYNMDCIEGMKLIEDKSIDIIITDCPYHIVSGGCTTGIYGNKQCGEILKKNKDDDTKYTKQGKLFKHNDIKFNEWLPEAYRILKDNSHCYIMINPRNLKELQEEAEKVGFIFQNLLIWDKGNSTPNRYYLNSYECILMLRKGKAKNINNMGTKNILKVSNLRGNKNHPTEKPIELMEILIKNSSNENDIVFDPFLGAGSTAIASKNNNRKYIGFELDEKYYNIAKDRLLN